MLGKGKKRFKFPRITTVIGQHTEIVGDVTFHGGLHIDGTIKGNVKAKENADSFLALSEDGVIEGEVHVPNVILNGTVRGDVYASTRIELANKARITGNLHYNLLEMEIGSEVNGKLLRITEEEPPMLSHAPPPAMAASLETSE